jgi:hypothetical protein
MAIGLYIDARLAAIHLSTDEDRRAAGSRKHKILNGGDPVAWDAWPE